MGENEAQPQSPLQQAASAGPQLPSGLNSLPPGIEQQFMDQMREDRDAGKQAQTNRQSALQAYQEAIKAAPDKLRPVDAFNSIGEGFYANPNWMWNPSEALASGFQRMNDLQAFRRKQAMEAPIAAAKVGFEDAKDASDKYLSHNLTAPANLMPFLTQQMRTTGALDRQLLSQYQDIYKVNYIPAINAGDPDAEKTAQDFADRYWRARGLRTDDINAREFARPGSTAGVPPAGAGVQPSSAGIRGPDWAAPAALGAAPLKTNADMRAAMSGPFAVPQDSTTGVDEIAAYRKMVQDPSVPAQQRKAMQEAISYFDDQQRQGPSVSAPLALPTKGTPGLTIAQEAERQALIERQKEGARAVAGDTTKQALDYIKNVNTDALEAVQTRNVLDSVETGLKKLADNKQTGKLAPMKELLATWKVAFDPDGKLGLSSDEDRENAKNFEATNKENFILATQAVRGITGRPTQIEFLRAAQNNPNAVMTPGGASSVIKLMRRTLDDRIDQQKDLNEALKKQGIELSNFGRATPEQIQSVVGHQIGYTSMAAERANARLALERLGEKGLDIGKGVSVQPYWSNKYRSLVAKFPDGTIRKINLGSTEE